MNKNRNEKRNYKVDNAIIMAAGMSSRLAPLSFERPKALFDVKGEVLLERQIRQLKETGIDEIIVVVGYKKEMFAYLIEKFQVKLVENPDYLVRNNHSSLYAAREYLKNSYICSADNYFTNVLFEPYEENTFYSAVYEEGKTNEWCLDTDEQGRIRQVTIGGEDEWVMHGHAFFTEDFSKQLIPYLTEAYFSEKAADLFWEEIYMEHLDTMSMYKKEFARDLILEFDNLEDLREFDEKYKNHSGCLVMKKICEKIKCEEKELENIKPIIEQSKVSGITFLHGGKQYSFDYHSAALHAYEYNAVS